MADESRPRPPILKRFANLDIDGVELERKRPEKRPRATNEAPPTVVSRPTPTPPRAMREAAPDEIPRPLRRQAPTPPSRPIAREQVPGRDDWRGQGLDLQALERLGAELNDNARTSRQSATPEARRAQRAAELRLSRPPDPRPTRPLTPAEVRERQAAQVRREVDRIRFDLRQASAEELELELPVELRSGGVMTVETRLDGRRALDMRFEARPMPSRRAQRDEDEGPLWDLPRTAPPPWAGPPRPGPPGVNAFTEQSGARPRALAAPNLIELTPMAARQIQLMAWEAGVPGSPLRILTSHTPGLGHPEIDFAFDEEITPEDTVVDALGVTVVIDPQSLAWVRGRRITWHDVPGSEGFLVR